MKSQSSNEVNADDEDVVKRIKELLENYVKPAVEMDGGAIQFRSYEDGKVNLMLQGSCSGCPSSMITLKAGIEGMMKRMIPEVKEVVADKYKANIPLGRFGSAEDIANATLFLASDMSNYITGQTISVCGGLNM